MMGVFDLEFDMSEQLTQELIEKSFNSNISRSSRGIFRTFIHTSHTTGQEHISWTSLIGTATLLKLEDSFFALTPKHVFQHEINSKFQSRIPFLVPTKSQKSEQEKRSFLVPIKIWNIYELIDDDIPLINCKDIILVEFDSPMKNDQPDYYLDLSTSQNDYLSINDFFNELILIANGYPLERNLPNYKESEVPKGFTHSIGIERLSIAGVCIIENGYPLISYEYTEGENRYEDHNGMSGGVVCSINLRSQYHRYLFAGIILTGGERLQRFLPAYKIIPAIKEYKKCSFIVIKDYVQLR